MYSTARDIETNNREAVPGIHTSINSKDPYINLVLKDEAGKDIFNFHVWREHGLR
jgi:hypothetical protein